MRGNKLQLDLRAYHNQVSEKSVMLCGNDIMTHRTETFILASSLGFELAKMSAAKATFDSALASKIKAESTKSIIPSVSTSNTIPFTATKSESTPFSSTLWKDAVSPNNTANPVSTPTSQSSE